MNSYEEYVNSYLLQNKLKSLKVAKWRKYEWRMMNEELWMKNDKWRMNEGWWRMMKDDEGWWRMKDEWRMMKDDNFKLLKGFAIRQTNKLTNEQTFASVESLSGLKYMKTQIRFDENIYILAIINQLDMVVNFPLILKWAWNLRT